ncbi:MAG: ATP-binding protein [Bacteroidetes bacterium]|nr:MAG: ATP-binding protein [Bacteroidota bacterium]
MNTNANFKVDPRLASLLGENYRSTELAIKELIDNAYDADAAHVWVELPRPLSDDPIVIRDDGTGMTEAEVRNEYLKIASSRASRKGDRTRLKNRLVKGRKGIGKFAGLMVASLMDLRTYTRGRETQLRIWRDELIRARHDLEQIDLPLTARTLDTDTSGTEIILSGINQNFTFPNGDRLKRLLVLEYGRMDDFKIYVDGELVDIENIPGDAFEQHIPLDNGEAAMLRFTISNGKQTLKQSGIALRVGGKIVGSPQYFGLEENEDFPPRLLRRVYGEVAADSLEADVTADWGSVIDNSKVLHELREKVRPVLEAAFRSVFDREMHEARSRLKRRINGNMERLPAHRKVYAQRFLDKVLHKFYGESETRIFTVVSLLLDAFNQDDHWVLMQQLGGANGASEADLTEVFSRFGMLDVALIAQQSSQRLAILQDLEKLILDPASELTQIRRVMASNLWLLGPGYPLVSTSQELEQVIDMYTGHKFTNGHAKEAPTLLLLQDFSKRFLLLDFKTPDHMLDLQDRRRAKAFQEDLQVYLPGRKIDVLIIGGALGANLVHQRTHTDLRFLSYKGLISDARVQLNWLLSSLQERREAEPTV